MKDDGINRKRNFILQQGFDDPPRESCGVRYSALMFQPRIILGIVVVGILFQSGLLFLILSAVLGWSALFPRWNPFDAVYNATLGSRPDALRLTSAPPARRFAQGLAGGLALAAGAFLLRGSRVAAFFFEGFLLAAVLTLAFGGFCFGSFVFHLLRGRTSFARRTLPRARGHAR
ncbi:MAG TPA: DUF4395 family protein [Thermoanaerobaculia bacterium]|nr:DUF4395 family protein [Thermoanaerobaculia bacterium]